jgi:hypothetical protein
MSTSKRISTGCDAIIRVLAAAAIPYKISGREIEADFCASGHCSYNLDTTIGKGGTINSLFRSLHCTTTQIFTMDRTDWPDKEVQRHDPFIPIC